MASDKTFRTVHGIVQFPPRDGEAGGKTVRNITVRQAGFKEQAIMVSGTLWPSHEAVVVNEGDVVTMEGSYTQNKGTKQDGTAVTYHNMSINRILVLGASVSGVKPDVENESTSDEPADDDIPF